MQTAVKERVRAVYANAQHRQRGKERKKKRKEKVDPAIW